MTTSPPLLERWVGGLTGELLAWLGRRAMKRGDVHEFQHCRQALINGNSNHSMWPCTLPATADETDLAINVIAHEVLDCNGAGTSALSQEYHRRLAEYALAQVALRS